MDWDYVELEDADVAGALLVVGVPSAGTVGPIAASFLVEHLRMRLVGGVQSEALPPVGIVRGGLVASPIQVWASDMACGLDGRCDRLLVLKSDIPLEPEMMGPLAGFVVRWASKHRVGLIVGLEGYPAESPPPGQQGLLTASSVSAVEAAKRLRAEPIKEAALSGFNAALLVRANRERVPLIGLFAPVSKDTGDAAAATELLRVIDPLVPNIGMAPSELAKRAEAVEAQLKAERAQQERLAQRLEEQVDRGYV